MDNINTLLLTGFGFLANILLSFIAYTMKDVKDQLKNVHKKETCKLIQEGCEKERVNIKQDIEQLREMIA
jgi:hypothetical protein